MKILTRSRGIKRRLTPILAISVILFAAGCVSGGGVSLLTNPKTYLAEYPIGEPQQGVFDRMGAPDNQTSVDGREVWSYTMGEGYGLRRWSFVFEDGKVYDVRYNDQGPYNGLTARGLQGLN